ncbi:DUF924 family protein [Telmatospirillum sp. J64-1]|uniref:DUF924 family protein n=1 Tax=Telmatospirillum sp. J64-1 TaxID=2502183 RepID=UPI001C8F9352|nr:DUF924 family protein [Telmatospirillum sp. J64-1]
MSKARAREILDFWFDDSTKPRWFAPDAAFDEAIRQRFEQDYEKARAGQLGEWEEHPETMLALILLLDQFPRNMYRATPRAFEGDDLALRLAQRAVSQGWDETLPMEARRFLYLPFEHSESLANQRMSVALFERWEDDPEGLDYARRHLEVIERFGRFPHRNAILGRPSTPEEIEFLKQPGSSF